MSGLDGAGGDAALGMSVGSSIQPQVYFRMRQEEHGGSFEVVNAYRPLDVLAGLMVGLRRLAFN